MNYKSGTQDFQTWGRAPSSGSHRKTWSTKSEKQAEKYRVPFVILVLQRRNVNVFTQKPVCNCSFIYNHQNQETLQCPSSGQWINYHTCGYTTPWMNLSNKRIMLSERNQTEKLLAIGFHLSDILETAGCRDTVGTKNSRGCLEQRFGEGTDCEGALVEWRGYFVSIMVAVCGDSYTIVYLSYKSLNPRRVKFIINKLYNPPP